MCIKIDFVHKAHHRTEPFLLRQRKWWKPTKIDQARKNGLVIVEKLLGEREMR